MFDLSSYNNDKSVVCPREPMPFVSTSSYNKLILRAVHQEDVKLLKTYINDSAQISKVTHKHSNDHV